MLITGIESFDADCCPLLPDTPGLDTDAGDGFHGTVGTRELDHIFGSTHHPGQPTCALWLRWLYYVLLGFLFPLPSLLALVVLRLLRWAPMCMPSRAVPTESIVQRICQGSRRRVRTFKSA